MNDKYPQPFDPDPDHTQAHHGTVSPQQKSPGSLGADRLPATLMVVMLGFFAGVGLLFFFLGLELLGIVVLTIPLVLVFLFWFVKKSLR